MSTFSDALLIFAGLTGVTSIMSFQGLTEGKAESTAVSTTIINNRNEFNARISDSDDLKNLDSLQAAVAQEQQTYIDAEWRESSAPAWELTAAQLVGVDSALALAKLRIDLEAELRRIAADVGIDVRERPVGAAFMMRELVARGALPLSLQRVLGVILDVANRAIHGREVGEEVAVEAVTVGSQTLAQLRAYPREHASNVQ